MASSKHTQAASAASVTSSAIDAEISRPTAASFPQTSSDRIVEELLSQITMTAYSTEQRLRETPVDNPELHEYEMYVLRDTVARLGWMADVALKRLGSSDCLQGGDAAAWLLPPTTSAALAQGAQA